MAVSHIYALSPLQAYFAVEEARWHGDPICPYCGGPKVWPHPDSKRRAPRLQCGSCFRTFCVTVGTLFHRTHIPMRVWLLALAHLAEKPEISAREFADLLGIRRRATVSKMLTIIRSKFLTEESDRVLIKSLLALFGVDSEKLDKVYFNAV
jgi:transposase-like protein